MKDSIVFFRYYQNSIFDSFENNKIKTAWNKSLKPTDTHVTLFAEDAKLTPCYGSLALPLSPKFYLSKNVLTF